MPLLPKEGIISSPYEGEVPESARAEGFIKFYLLF